MNRRNYRKFVIILALIICSIYVPYRAIFTLNTTTWYALFASVFLLIGECFAIMTLLLYFVQVWDVRDPPEQPVLEGRTVDVLVTTYNEDVQLLRATLRACARMDYPHRTYVLDDGRRPEVETLARELGANYITRPDNRHAKAGNLNHALERTDGEFVVVLDADHVPEPNFISRVIGYFADEQLGYVQTPHAFYNFDSFQARLNHKRRYYWEESEVFYYEMQPGKNYWGCPIFAGSAAMFRRKALEDVGYIATETITEDLHTGLRINAKGWKSLAIRDRLIAGQAAPDITTFHSQRLRWATGNLSIMAYDNPLTMRGLTVAQRLCYFGSMIHWSAGLFKLAIYLTPILMLFTGVPPVAKFTWSLGIITAFYLIVALYALKVVTNGYGSFINWEFFSMMGFWVQIRATLRALFRRRTHRFVVTSKRGRQTKRLWPYVIPHASLIGLTVLALLWAWGRVAIGVSDDYYKPIVASMWALFHLTLACVVVRRMLWPDDRRFAYRHLVNLPVAYEVPSNGAQANRRLGLTVDLSEMGLSLVAYEPLPVDSRLRLLVHGGGETIEGRGRIRWRKELAHTGRNGFRRPGGYRYGVTLELNPEQADVLHRVCLQYAVPRLYEEYGSGHARTVWQRLWERLAPGYSERRSERRFAHRLPLILQPDGPPGSACYTVTEDINRQTVSALLDTDCALGAETDFLMGTPLGEVRGRAQVVREWPRRVGSQTYKFCVLRLPHFDEQGRDTLRTLVNPPEHRHLDPLLSPDKEPLRVPLSRPLLLGLLALLPFVLLEVAAFGLTYREDFFLRDIARGTQEAGPQELERIGRIYEETMQQGYPGTDRIVLLQGALNQIGHKPEIDQLTKLLAPRDQNNLGLQVALVHALDNLHEYDRAETEYQEILKRNGRLSEKRREDLLRAAARSSVHAGHLDRAIERFQQLLALHPDDMELRNEYASVLLSARKLKEAEQLYAGHEPDVAGHWLLVYTHVMSKEFDKAEKECRAILLLRPSDHAAELLLGDVLSYKKGFAQSRQIYDRLLKINGKDPEVQIRLANITLWSQNYNEALPLFQGLLENGHNRPDIVKGFIDAAASADQVGEPQKKLALAIYDQTVMAPDGDPIFLARLAWVLQRVQDLEKSAALLARALDLAPKNRTLRQQYVGTLISAGRVKEALQVLEGDEQDLQTRELRIHVYLRSKNFQAALEECRQVLQARPKDRKIQRLLADILSWQKNYKESLTLFEQLVSAEPNSQELATRLAEVTLWSGDYPKALARYQVMLETSFEQPALWQGYVQAAAGAEHLNPAQQQLLTRIARQKEVRESKDPLFLVRLSWVLSRMKEPSLSTFLLERALALRPAEPAARKELAGVLAAAGKYKQALALLEQLAQADPKDAELPVRLAEVTLWSGDYAKALGRYEVLLEASFDRPELWPGLVSAAAATERLTPAQERLVLRIAGRQDLKESHDALFLGRLGWVLHRLKQFPQANVLFAQGVALRPVDPRVRKELAGILAAAGKNRDALEMYEGVPLDLEDRYRLVGLYSAGQDFANAEKQCRAILHETPEDPHAQRLLADVLSWKKDYKGSLAIFETLAKANPKDAELTRRLAEVTLWSGDYAKAVGRYQALLETSFDLSDLWQSYIDVAAGAENLTPAQGRLAVRIAEQKDVIASTNALFLARLSWVLHRAKQPRLASTFFDKAVALQSPDPAVRRELASALAAAGKPKQALELYKGLKLNDQDRFRMAYILAAEKDFDGAEKLCRAILETAPDDTAAQQLLADVLSWNRKYEEAATLYQKLLQANPDDSILPVKLAQVALWSHDFETALERYHKLLQKDRTQAELWGGYIDAAASARQIGPAHKNLVLYIYEQNAENHKPPIYLSRLAWVLRRLKESEKALGLLTRALAAEPGARSIRLQVAETLYEMQRYDEAEEQFRILLEAASESAQTASNPNASP